MSIALLSSITYRIAQSLLCLLSLLFSAKCLQKFLSVRKEKNNPLNTLKRLFWVFSISANLSYVIYYLLGFSNAAIIKSKVRVIGEIFEATPISFFYCMLITTLVIIEESVKMAVGKGFTEKSWGTLFWFLSCPALLFFAQLHWVVFIFFTNVWLNNKEYVRGDEFIMTFSLVAFYYQNSLYDFFSSVLSVVGVLEGVLFLTILQRLIPVLKRIYSLMKQSDKANRVKKAKLKEWAIFISLCSLVAFLRLAVSVLARIDEMTASESIKFMLNEKPGDGSEVYNGKKADDFYFIQRYDFSRLIIGITIGIASSFIAPCRKIKKT